MQSSESRVVMDVQSTPWANYSNRMQRVRLDLSRRFGTRQTEDAPTSTTPNPSKEVPPAAMLITS